jgi:hypothetical protein
MRESARFAVEAVVFTEAGEVLARDETRVRRPGARDDHNRGRKRRVAPVGSGFSCSS